VNKFVTYNSSAGSGKTYTLVKEYLKIALETENERAYRHILAVTFTNKAAAEMKERVVFALQALSGLKTLEGTPQFLLTDLIQPVDKGGLGIGKEAITARSKKVLRSILHNYNDFGISTIDKFTHKIIRTFAHDLHLPLNFDIELDETEALSNAIDILIAQVGVNEELTKLLVEYTKRRADDEQSWHIEQELFNFSKNLLKDDGELYLEKIRALKLSDFENIKKQLIIETKAFEEKLKSLCDEALTFVENKGVEATSFSSSFYTKYWIGLEALKRDKEGGLKRPTATILKIINGEKNWYAATVDASQQQLIDSNQAEFIRLFNESRAFVSEFESEYLVNNLLIKNLYNLAVINEVEKAILEFKKENNVLNISDFNKRISKIVESEPIPFIYERIGEKFNHYLVDEFQDTSIVQWHNIVPLLDNSLASGHFNMIVGDAKQAIYRWRGGEVEQIINLPDIYKHKNNPLLIEREASLKRNHKNEELNNNFRSKAEVVQFNNDFFQSVSINLSEKYQALYKNLEQKYSPKNTGGGVDIQFLEAKNKEELTEQNFESVMKIIEQNLSANYQLSDVAILTRNNIDGAAVASYLVENGIHVISSESLLLNSSKEVQCLIDLFRYITNPTDNNYQLPVINYLIHHYYSNDNLFDVFSKYPTNTLEQYLVAKNLQINAAKITNLSLYELTEHLINHFKLDVSVNVYIQFFLDKVFEYVARNDNSVINFLEWWELKNHKFSIVVPEGVDAVRVMSVHKSKGLEFPVVIYPFATSEVKLSEKFFWTNNTKIERLKSAILPINKEIKSTEFASIHQDEMDKSVLDLINVMYVALTRPKDRLYILSEKKDKPSRNGSVSDYLYNYCEDKTENQLEENHYVFGKFLPQENKKETTTNDELFNSVVYNNWRERIKISYQSPEVWDVENPQKIGEYGTLIHKILSEINRVEDVEDVLKKFLLKGIIHQGDLPKIEQEIEAVFKIEGVKALFSDFESLKNEYSILTYHGDSYQPDRVIVSDEKTIVVDYKTGEKKDEHIQQIENYKLLLSEMGYTNIESYLLYTSQEKLEKV
jgi:ATP-dependent exoDNAse (exonuclease V) beta subunit